VGLGLIGNFLCEELYFHGYLMKKIGFLGGMGLGGQLGVVRSVSRVAGSDDLARCSAWFSSLVCCAMAKEPLSTYSFPLSGQISFGARSSEPY
jgi:hypothetical protein